MLLLNATGYALFNVPHLAMPAELTVNYHERTRLISFPVAGAAAGQLIIWFRGGAAGHAAATWLLGVIIVLSCVACLGRLHAAR